MEKSKLFQQSINKGMTTKKAFIVCGSKNNPTDGCCPDGDYTDITISGDSTIFTINSGVVSTNKLGGDITIAGKALLDDSSATDQRNTLGLGDLATLDQVGTTQIIDDNVTFDKIQNINTNKLLGRYSASTGNVEEITISTGLNLDGSGNLTVTSNEESVAFMDDFADSSIYWTWRQDAIAAGKTITESGSVLTIAVANGTSAVWTTATKTCPTATIGLPGAPCEIICKIDSATINENTDAGIFLSTSPVAGTASSTWGFYRHRDSGSNGLIVNIFGVAAVYSDSTTTLPIWLRIRISSHSTNGRRIFFAYSTDGNNYTTVWTEVGTTPSMADGWTCGLFARNFTTTNAVSASFDFFKMNRILGPG